MRSGGARKEDRKKSVFKKPELEVFRQLLVARRQALAGNVQQLEDEALRRSSRDASGDLSTMPIHLADIGTDNFEQDFSLGLIENEEQELVEINAALVRLDDGKYGSCETCSTVISKERLKAVPYARLCISCKRKEEESG